MKIARVIVADSDHCADMLYATGLFVPDPFIYFEIAGQKHVVMSDLEIDRAKKVATVDQVHSLSQYQKQFGVRRLDELLPALLREHNVRAVEIPFNFPAGIARKLRNFRVNVVDPFFPDREIKTAAEIRKLTEALRLAEEGMNAGINAIKQSRIGRGGFLYWRKQKLTSEHLQGVINATIAALGGNAAHTIVAGGNQACDPHEAGHGPLRGHQTIILDIFPRDLKTGYWGDITRTVVRGRASERVRGLFAVVAKGQEIAFDKLRAGVDGQTIHNAILDLFNRHGFPTGRNNERMQGFFHGTGHGLGLEIHEAPRVAPVKSILRVGQVVTVEPGLYYPGLGGVRLEDVVVIGKTGNRNLTRFPKFLEV
ncbi:MAG: Xaa-Pro peptidase family protein [Verrucomicrobiota bacterium]